MNQSISIVVPAYNEEKFLEKTLDRIISLISNRLDADIIVVNNASTDKTHEIISHFKKIKEIQLSERVTISAARNIGWQKAKNPVIAFIDSDVLLTPEWIDSLLSILAQNKENPHPLLLTGFPYYLSEDPHWIETAWFGNLKPSRHYVNGGNIVISKELLVGIDGFDESLITAEDVDLCKRAQNYGAELKLNKNLVTHHEGNPKSIPDFYRREKWHGTGDCQSVKAFLSSKVAIFATINMALVILFLFSIVLGTENIVFPALLALLGVNGIIVFKKFGLLSFKHFLQNLYLNFIYLIARFFSLFNER